MLGLLVEASLIEACLVEVSFTRGFGNFGSFGINSSSLEEDVSSTAFLDEVMFVLLVEALLVEALLVEALLVEALLVEALLVEALLVEALLVEALLVEALLVEALLGEALLVKALHVEGFLVEFFLWGPCCTEAFLFLDWLSSSISRTASRYSACVITAAR
jgi:uncharacterized protein YjbI with pentapeptide repeats